ncbi:hypothetical protein ACJJTC_018964 [Scirpophaga incertulas]
MPDNMQRRLRIVCARAYWLEASGRVPLSPLRPVFPATRVGGPQTGRRDAVAGCGLVLTKNAIFPINSAICQLIECSDGVRPSSVAELILESTPEILLFLLVSYCIGAVLSF